MSDELKLADEKRRPGPRSRAPWTILIVDDEPEVHSVTKLALDGVTFSDRELRFLHAYSGKEAIELLEKHPETAIMLLDVVMETERAGLDVVQHVRSIMKNSLLRIILRTGQPGQAPELEVITRYDINDYKYKTELTRERLFTTVYTALSAYRDLAMLDASRRGLEKVIDASAQIFELRSVDRFAQGVLEQLTALLFFDADALMAHASGVATAEDGKLVIVAGTGRFREMIGKSARGVLPDDVLAHIDETRDHAGHFLGETFFVDREHVSGSTDDLVFFVTADHALPEPDQNLLSLFCRNVAIARENLRLMAAAPRKGG